MSEKQLIANEDQARDYVAGLADETAMDRLDRFARMLIEDQQGLGSTDLAAPHCR